MNVYEALIGDGSQEPRDERINHIEFLRRIFDNMREKESELIDFAYDLAKYGHRNQLRDNGERYFEHCRRTALILIDELQLFSYTLIAAALLHDMLEDNYLLTDSRIELIFGPQVANLVKTVTKPKKTDLRFKCDNERHQFYFEQIKNASNEIKFLKLLDRLQNMREIGNCAPEKQARKRQETIEVYLPLISDIQSQFPYAARFFRIEFAKIL